MPSPDRIYRISKMIYKIQADLMVALHLAWIFFLFLGAFGGVRSRRVKIFHLSGLGFAVLMQVFDWYCPLTHLEVYLRARHNPATSSHIPTCPAP